MLLQSLQYQQLPGENHSIPVMSHAAADMTVLERQMGCLQWRQQQQRLRSQSTRQVQQQPSYFADAIASDTTLLIPSSTPYSLPQVPPHILQAAGLCGEIGHGFSGGSAGAWPDDVTHYPFPCNSGGPGEGVLGGTGEGALSRSSTSFGCPVPLMMSSNVVDVESRGRPTSPPASLLEHASTAKQGGAAGGITFSTDGERESSKRRKSTDQVEGDDDRAKKMIKVENTATPVEPNVESPASTVITTTTTTTNYCKDYSNNNRDSSSRPEKKKAAEPVTKTDYIHVRARRGQATDSHSLAERVRREKISDRMKLLQGLVPGCNKITGKAGMLDEIINYVQSLQRQVEFLSMKLAAVTPSVLGFNLDALITKELSTLAGGCGIPPPDQMGLIPELLGLSFLQLFDPLQQQQAMASAAAAAAAEECCALPVPMLVSSCCNSAQDALRGVVAGSGAGTAPDSCSFPDPRNTLVHPRPSDQLTTSPGWEGELQSFYAGAMEGFEQGS